MLGDKMAESREERRRKARAAEQRRRDELEEALGTPPLKPFEAPTTGHVTPGPSGQRQS